MMHSDIAEYRPVADACQRPLLPRVAVTCFFHVYGYRPFIVWSDTFFRHAALSLSDCRSGDVLSDLRQPFL